MLAKLGPRVDRLALKWVHSGEHRSPAFAAWGERLWRHPVLFGTAALAILVALALPVLGLKTGMPSIKVVPQNDTSRQGYELVQSAFGEGAPGALQIVGPAAGVASKRLRSRRPTPGIARVMPVQAGRRRAGARPGRPQHGSRRAPPSVRRSTACAPTFRPACSLGGATAENHDLEQALAAKTPLVIGVVLVLGFLLLLLALQAPVIAAVGVVTNLLAVGAAFGVARLIFQDGHGAGLLGFESQGFIDAWGPVFFFAMIFAISMDYTVFLLSSAKEHYDRNHDPKEAMVGGLAHSGRVIFAAAAVMVAVFLTFALSGPLPPKEMGVILGVAVLLDALLIRLVLIPVVAPAARDLGVGAAALARPRPSRRAVRALMSLTATARSIPGSLRQEIVIDGRHHLTTDEPVAVGGEGSAPAPHELLVAALAGCVSTVLVMYARTKQWDLGEVSVDVDYDHHATPRRARRSRLR